MSDGVAERSVMFRLGCNIRRGEWRSVGKYFAGLILAAGILLGIGAIYLGGFAALIVGLVYVKHHDWIMLIAVYLFGGAIGLVLALMATVGAFYAWQPAIILILLGGFIAQGMGAVIGFLLAGAIGGLCLSRGWKLY